MKTITKSITSTFTSLTYPLFPHPPLCGSYLMFIVRLALNDSRQVCQNGIIKESL